jgi:hypothetical protein
MNGIYSSEYATCDKCGELLLECVCDLIDDNEIDFESDADSED